MSRPSPSGAPLRCAALTWGGAWSLARTGRGRGRGLRQTADKKPQGKAHVRQEGTWGPLRRLRLTRFPSELIIRFRQGHFELLLKLLICCFQFFDAAIFGEDYQIAARIGFTW